MKLTVVYLTSALMLVFGCGAWFFGEKEEAYHEEPFNEVALCEARGGEWVKNADMPLCMTPDAGLLELVDGSFVAFTSDDPWKNESTAPLAGMPLGSGESGAGMQEVEPTSLSPATCQETTVMPYTGKVAAVDFSSWPEATKYRTAITKDVARGVNFAGSYVVSTWGCGRKKHDACVGHAVIDAKTGKILLYGVIGKRTGEFSLTSTGLTIDVRGEGKETWSIEEGALATCEELAKAE